MSMIIPTWTTDDEKRFELALLRFPIGSQGFMENITQLLQKPVKEVTEVMFYHVCKPLLVGEEYVTHDKIDSGNFDVPIYPKDDYYVPKASQSTDKEEEKKKKGNHWSKDEHISFLRGFRKYGKGDWKSIARECVKSRSSKQVASHAQKYFQRQKSMARKRNSIHDLTMEVTDKLSVDLGSNLESIGQLQDFGVPLKDNAGVSLDAVIEEFPSFFDFPPLRDTTDNVTAYGSNLESMGHQQHFGIETPLQLPFVDNVGLLDGEEEYRAMFEEFPSIFDFPHLRDASNATVPGSSMESMGQQQHFGVPTPLEVPVTDNSRLLDGEEEYRAIFEELPSILDIPPLRDQQQFGIQTPLQLPFVENDDHEEYMANFEALEDLGLDFPAVDLSFMKDLEW